MARGEFTKHPIYFDGMDGIFDEHGTMFLTMRKTQWVEDGENPDPEKAKLELRKYRVTAEGERPDKGFSFLTEDGPHELVNVLIENGYGDTREVLLKLRERENFKEVVETLFESPEENTDGEYFDMRSVLLQDDATEQEEQ